LHSLTGCWNGEMDTFYQHLTDRINEYATNPPGPDWDGVILKKQ